MSDGHPQGPHAHGVSREADPGKIPVALALIVGFMVAEVVAGIIANSLALSVRPSSRLPKANALPRRFV